VARRSMILNDERQYGQSPLPPIEHHVVWDADLAATSAGVVGSILEWPGKTPDAAVDATLQAIIDFYRLKNALQPSKSAADGGTKYGMCAAAHLGRGRCRA